jgi:hypothetical protein
MARIRVDVGKSDALFTGRRTIQSRLGLQSQVGKQTWFSFRTGLCMFWVKHDHFSRRTYSHWRTLFDDRSLFMRCVLSNRIEVNISIMHASKVSTYRFSGSRHSVHDRQSVLAIRVDILLRLHRWNRVDFEVVRSS